MDILLETATDAPLAGFNSFLGILIVGVLLSLFVEWAQRKFGVGSDKTKLMVVGLSVLLGAGYYFLQGTAMLEAIVTILSLASAVYVFAFKKRVTITNTHMPNKPEYLIVHHTGGTNEKPLADTSHHTFEMVNEYHRKRWNFKSSLGFYIGYHYYIEQDGKLTQGRADTDEGAHTIDYNTKSIGICLAGNFDRETPTPSPAQIATLRRLLRAKMEQYSIPRSKVVPHRTFAVKTCYGSKLADNWASELTKEEVRFIKQDNRPEVWLITPQGLRLWILDPNTRDRLGLTVEKGDPTKYEYGGAIGAFEPDDPLNYTPDVG